MKVFLAAFFLVTFWQKALSFKKHARKMLMKWTPGVNFTIPLATSTNALADRVQSVFTNKTVPKFTSSHNYRVCHEFRLTKYNDYFWLILTTFESSSIFGGSWGKIEN